MPNRCHPNEGEFEKICGKEGEEMRWISCKTGRPNYGKFVLFCLNTSDKTVYLGWLENKKDIKFNEDMWFSDSNGQWFTENEVLGWCEFPKPTGL